uniref:Uncharacterized protein n=1 Tax=Rhizophagus clarus TaxID=94130 RepID=A0A140D0B3_9GLOM|nr:hypothetical protein [Rhizophagus clarus]
MKFTATIFLVIFLVLLINLESASSVACICPLRCRFVDKRYPAPVSHRKRAPVPVTCNCSKFHIYI